MSRRGLSRASRLRRETALVFLFAPGDDHEGVVGQGTFQLERFIGRCGHPGVDLFPRRKYDGHGLRVNRADDLVGSVVKNAKRSLVVSPSLTFRTEVQRVQMPAKKARGRVSLSANQAGGRLPSASFSCSAKLVKGNRQRLSIPSQRRQ
jgi:hypothetical protein